MFIKEYSNWKIITEGISGFDKIFESSQDSPFPTWAGYTMDVLITTEKRPDYKITLVNSNPICKVDEERSTEEYKMISINFSGCSFDKIGTRFIGPSESGPFSMWAKSTEPWYIYQDEVYPSAGKNFPDLDESSKMYCNPTGGTLVNAIKRASKLNLKPVPNPKPAEIEGNTLKWARENDTIKDLIWEGNSVKSHFMTWFAAQGKVKVLTDIIDNTLKKNIGKFNVTIKNPGLKDFGSDVSVQKLVDGQYVDFTPGMIEKPEVVSESRIYESKLQILDSKEVPEKDKKSKDKMKGTIYQIRDQFVLKPDETEESERFIEWKDKEIESGYRVSDKWRFSRDLRDKNVYWSMIRVLPEVIVQVGKDGVVKVRAEKLKEVLSAAKRTILDLDSDRTYKSNLEVSEYRYDLLKTLRRIFGERRQTKEMTEMSESKKKEFWESCIKSSDVLDPRSHPYGQSKNYTAVKKNNGETRYIKTSLYDKMKKRFYELKRWNFTQGYTSLSDIFGENNGVGIGKSDRNYFKQYTPQGRQAISDIRLAYKKELITKEEFERFENILYPFNIEKKNQEVKEHNARVAAERARREAQERADSPVLTAIGDAWDAGVDFASDTWDAGVNAYNTADKALNDKYRAINTWYDQTWLGQTGKEFDEWVDKKIVDPIKDFGSEVAGDIGEMYTNSVITPLGIYLNIDILSAKVTEYRNDFLRSSNNGSLSLQINTSISIKLTRKSKDAVKSKNTSFNITGKSEFDIDLKNWKIKLDRLKVSELTMDWVEADVEDLLPGIPWLPRLKFKIDQEGGKFYIKVKTAADPIKGEGDDWWEWYDKNANKIKDYTYKSDVTSKIQDFIGNFTKSVDDLNLKQIAGLK